MVDIANKDNEDRIITDEGEDIELF